MDRDGFVKRAALAANSYSWHSSYMGSVRAEKIVHCFIKTVIT